MQPVNPLPSSGKVALQQGAVVGACMAGVHIVLAALNSFVFQNGIGSFIAILLLIVLWIVSYLIAGIRGSKVTGRVSTGTLAGLWCAIIAGVIALLVNIIFAFATADSTRVRSQAFMDQFAKGQHIVYTNSMVVGSSALYNTCFLIVGIGLGAGVGALGGLIGRSRAPIPPQPYPYYPAMPQQ